MTSCLAPCFPTATSCQAKEEEWQKENSLSSWVTNPSVPSPPITNDLIVIHVPLLSESINNLASTIPTSTAVSTQHPLTTTTAAISTAISANSQDTCTSTAISTAIFSTSSGSTTHAKHSPSTSVETVENRRGSVSVHSKTNERIIQYQRNRGNGLSSGEGLVSSRLKWALAPVHKQGLHLHSSSESDFVSPTSKFDISPSVNLAPPGHYQRSCNRVPQQPCIHPTSSKKGIPRPNYLATEHTVQVNVPCHAVFCAYSTSPEARNLQALLRESARIHSVKAHRTSDMKHGRTSTHVSCCSGGNPSPLLSKYRPTTIGKSSKNSPGTTVMNTGQLPAGSRPSCLLCQQSSSSSRTTRHTRGRQAVLCMVLSHLLPQAALSQCLHLRHCTMLSIHG